MAKRKKRKNDKKNKFEFSFQLYGIILIILSIMAFGAGKPLGWIGKLMRCFAIFLFGTLDWLFLICVFCLGIYILFKGKAPSLWSTKFIGILIVTIGILVFGHLNYVLENDGNATLIFEVTIDDIMRTFENVKSELPFTTYGTGIIGCSLAVLFNILFDHTGTKIVSIILMITGFCFFTGFSIVDFIKNGLEKRINCKIWPQSDYEMVKTTIDDYINDENAPFINRAFSAFSVGSVFKTVTAATCLENDIFLDTFNCTGKININGTVFNCNKKDGHGNINFDDALSKSCNSYFVNYGLKLTAEQIIKSAKMLHLGESVDLGNGFKTSEGVLPQIEDCKNQGDIANLSFGQGKLSATPLQIAAIFSAPQ